MGRKINEQHVVPPFPTTFRVARRFTVILSFGFSRAKERFKHMCAVNVIRELNGLESSINKM